MAHARHEMLAGVGDRPWPGLHSGSHPRDNLNGRRYGKGWVVHVSAQQKAQHPGVEVPQALLHVRSSVLRHSKELTLSLHTSFQLLHPEAHSTPCIQKTSTCNKCLNGSTQEP
jgi:hypothetical protein